MTRAHLATEGSVAQDTAADESVIPEPILLTPVTGPLASQLGEHASGADAESIVPAAEAVPRGELEAAAVNGSTDVSVDSGRDSEGKRELPATEGSESEPGSSRELDPGADEEVSADQLLVDDGEAPVLGAPAISGVVAAPGLDLGELPPSYPPSDPVNHLEGSDSLEVGAVEVGLITGEPSVEAGAAGERASAPGFHAPWVDEVPDAVTPYEQRHSETVKLAELPPVELLRGRVVANRYLVEEFAERTPAGVSYRAYHLALDRAVTVRVLPRGLACSDELCQEVRRVARLATELEHPHIAGTLDFGVTNDGWPFLVSEHYSGRTLAALLADEGKFVLRRVLHIGKHVAAALAAAHQAGLTHGLLTPDNVMVIEPGTSAEVGMLLGFGVSAARGVTPAPPRSGVFGVPFYVSPEQASCKATDARSDLYSVGVILYELMTGVPPFVEGDFAAVLCQHLDE
ncbi:MAG TPA: serine/threonine-protein kinase, partial [Polyangiaceae bacterium]|nr:serine/threonine-protein kinase [Polyangiaceae bacterium]